MSVSQNTQTPQTIYQQREGYDQINQSHQCQQHSPHQSTSMFSPLINRHSIQHAPLLIVWRYRTRGKVLHGRGESKGGRSTHPQQLQQSSLQRTFLVPTPQYILCSRVDRQPITSNIFHDKQYQSSIPTRTK